MPTKSGQSPFCQRGRLRRDRQRTVRGRQVQRLSAEPRSLTTPPTLRTLLSVVLSSLRRRLMGARTGTGATARAR